MTAAILAATMLAACGSSPVRGPDTGAGAAAAAADEPTVAAAAAEPERDARRDKRRNRSGGRENEAAAVPDGAAFAHERALAAMTSEDWLEAELELEQLVLAYPDLVGPYVNLAIVYMHDDRTADARGVLEKALALDPAHAAASNQLGIVLRKEGEFTAAEAAYRRALDADPQYALAHYNLGVLLDLYMRRPEDALEHYERYQDLMGESDQRVGRWIIDLRRRLGATDDASRVAREGGA